MFLSITLLSVIIGPPTTTGKVTFPKLGSVTVRAHSPKYDRKPQAFLEFRDGQKIVSRFDFEMGRNEDPKDVMDTPFPVRFTVVKVSGISSPLIVGTAGSHGGSDASFETLVIGDVGGSLKEVSKRFDTSTQDCVCITTQAGLPEIAVFTFSWTNESHYAPHYFTVTRLAWNGSQFVQRDIRATKHKVASWLVAAREFGISCGTDLTARLIPDER